MKSSMIKFGAYIAVFLLVGALIYVFAFFRPNANRITGLEQDIAAAHIELEEARRREAVHPQVQYDVQRLTNELNYEESGWERARGQWYSNFDPFLLDEFDIAYIEQRIDGIIRPHSEIINMYFSYSLPQSMMSYNENNPDGPPEGIWQTTANITFYAGYDSLIAILQGFANAGFDNRVVDYSLTRHNDSWRVNLQLDILTQTPHPYRFNGNYIVHD